MPGPASNSARSGSGRLKPSSGLSAIEYVIAIGILVFAGVMVIGALVKFNREQALSTETDRVAALVGQARTETLNSQEESQYGIHFSSGSVVLFKGSAYDAGDSGNISYMLSPLVSLTDALSGGVSDVIFSRLSGEASATGTVTLSLVSDASSMHSISIQATGLIERL